MTAAVLPAAPPVPRAPSPAVLTARMLVRFEVQRLTPHGDWVTIASSTRTVAAGQRWLDLLVDALAREHRSEKLYVRAAAEAILAGQVLTGWAQVGPRNGRTLR